MRAPFVLLLAAALAAADTEPAPPTHHIYFTADIVVVGKVERLGDDTAVVRVEQALKGEPLETVDVGPIRPAEGLPMPGGKPFFAVGDRVLVAARRAGNGYAFVDHTLESTRADQASLALAKEMLLVAALPDDAARRAAMIALLRSEDVAIARATAEFPLGTPQQCEPHVAGLVEALGAPHAEGRVAAMRGLKGLVPQEAVPRLIALSESADGREASAAFAALAPYDREDTVKALLAGIDGRRNVRAVEHLGECPRPEAHAWLREAVGGKPGTRRAAAFGAFAARLRNCGAQEGDVELLLAALRGRITHDEKDPLRHALREARSDLLAPALLAVAEDGASTADRREVAWAVLWEQAARLGVAATAEAVRGAEARLVACLDKGDCDRYLVALAAWLHTPGCRGALERAVAAGRDPDVIIRPLLAGW